MKVSPQPAAPAAADPEVDEATVQQGLLLVRPAAVLIYLTGLVFFFNAIQVFAIARYTSPEVLVGEVGSALFGILYLYAGTRVYDGDHNGTIAAVVLTALGWAFAAGWALFLLMNGALSLMPVLMGGGSALACVFAATMLPRTAQIARARQRLAG